MRHRCNLILFVEISGIAESAVLQLVPNLVSHLFLDGGANEKGVWRISRF
jgi:hypothetical protein